MFDFLDKYRDEGLLLLRAGFGAMFLVHGAPLLFGGPAVWKTLGAAMGIYGIKFLPEFWGFMAAFPSLAAPFC